MPKKLLDEIDEEVSHERIKVSRSAWIVAELTAAARTSRQRRVFSEAGERTTADADADGFSTDSTPRSPVRYSASVNEEPRGPKPRSSKGSAPGSKG